MSEPCGERQSSVFQRPREPSQGGGNRETGHRAMSFMCAISSNSPQVRLSYGPWRLGELIVPRRGIPEWKSRFSTEFRLCKGERHWPTNPDGGHVAHRGDDHRHSPTDPLTVAFRLTRTVARPDVTACAMSGINGDDLLSYPAMTDSTHMQIRDVHFKPLRIARGERDRPQSPV